MKNLKRPHIFFALFALLYTSTVFSQGNTCATALSLGSLPTPASCGGPSGTGLGTTVSHNGTTVGATAANPYTYIPDCGTGTTDMASPAIDVWYSFVATGSQLVVNMTGSLATPNVGIYSGTCSNLAGVGCVIGSAGGAISNAVFEPMVPGQTYYIQVSGNNSTSTGTFSLTINNNNDCNDCLQSSTLTASPLPINGTYGAGQSVTFCYQITGYTQVSSNWLHGIQLSFGSGWDPSTITTTSPASCSGSGTWAYYPTGIGTVNGVSWGAGFYYDYSSGAAGPQNNYGDYNAQNCKPKFCWTIQTDAVCSAGAPLSISVNTSGDGESGSWTSVACQDDPATTFEAVSACCSPPTMASTQVTCTGGTNGTATATVVSTSGPWDYVWYDASGVEISNLQNSASTSNSISNLPVGVYTIVITDNNGCVTGNSVSVTQAPGTTVTVPASFSVCANGSTAATNFTSSPAGATFTWTNSNTAIGLAASGSGNIAGFTAVNTTTAAITSVVTVTPTSGACAGVPSSYTITVNPAPIVTINTVTPICTGSVTLTGSFLPTPVTSAVTFANTNLVQIPNGNAGGGNPGYSSVTSTGVSPTTLTAGQIVSICFTLKHEKFTDISFITFAVNGTTYTSVTPAPAGQTYSADLATLLTSIRATANNTASTFCLPSTFISLLSGNSNTTWTIGVRDPVTGADKGDILDMTVVLNNTPTYSYAWTPTATLSGGSVSGSTTSGTLTVTATPTVTTTYTLSVTSSAGCVGTGTTTVVVTTPTASVNSATVCAGSSATLTASGATTYSWSPSTGLSSTTGTSVTASPTVTTTYTVVGTTGTCTASATSTVTVGNLTVTVNSPSVCAGASVTLNAGGGTTYSWSPATGLSATTGGSVTASPTVTTTYTVTGTTGTCTSTATSVVTVNSLTVTVNSPSYCTGGSATLTAAGASTYSWAASTGLSSTSGASVSANPTVTTTYTVTGTAVSGCTATATSTVTVNTKPTVTVNSGNYCTGGSLSLTAAGASTYSWAAATGLSATTGSAVTATPTVTTTYTVTGTAANGCTATATSTVTVNTKPTVTVSSGSFCAGGSASLTASGASTYSWAAATGLSATTGSVVTATPTVTTTYTVTGTAANSCTATATSTVTVSPNPTVTVNSATLCAGTSAALTASGATTYSWSPSTGLSATTGASVTANPTVTTTYTVTGTTGTCTATATSTITVNPIPAITATNTGPYCLGTTVQLNGTGGGTYSWSGPNSFTSTSASPSLGAAAAGLDGVYSLTVTALGCTATATTNVIINATLIPGLATSPACEGTTLSLTCSNGVVWSWTGPNGFTSSSQNPTISAVTAAASGTYSATVSDAGGCSGSGTISVVVNALPAVTVNSPAICIGGTANLTAAGASTYSWTAGTSTATGTTVTATPAVTTTYTVTGTDANGCINTATSTVTVNSLPVITVTNTGPYCLTSTIQLNAGGGTGYSWTGPDTFTSASQNPAIANAQAVNAGTYSVTVTDANGCVASGTTDVVVSGIFVPDLSVNSPVCEGDILNLACSNGVSWSWTGPNSFTSPAQNPSVAAATPAATGTYTISATDVSGCVGTATISAIVNALPTVTVNSPSVCVGATANLNAGGAATYSWSAGTSAFTGASVTATPGVTTTYTVTGTDANGCINTAASTVTVNSLPVIVVNSPSICPTFTATLNASGAATYSWTAGTTPSTGASVTATPTVTTSYTVTGTDINGCADFAIATVTVNSQLMINAGIDDTVCNGSNFTLTASAPAGTTYTWNPGNLSGASQSQTASATTTFTVDGVDANGCTGSDQVTITVPPVFILTTGGFATSCNGVCDGQAVVLASPATGPFANYQYSWNNGAATASANGLCANTYTVTVTDIAGCVATASATVTEPAAISASASNITNATCNGVCDGSALITASGGSGTYTYSWVPTASGNNPATLCAGSYVCTVADGSGCGTAVNVTITQPTPITVSVTPVPLICIGQTATLTASPAGGNGGYVYTWSAGTTPNNLQTVTASPTVTTNFTVSVTDSKNCPPVVASVTVNVSQPLNAVASPDAIICVGATQNLGAMASGGNGVYTYSWSAGTSPATGATVAATPTVTTTYTVTVTDGCGTPSASDNVVVTVNPIPALGITVSDASGCAPVCSDFTAVSSTATATVNWVFSNGASATGTPAANICFNTAGTYGATLSVTDVNGCSNTFTNNNLVTVYPVPVAAFSFSPHDATEINPVIYFTDSSYNATISNWSWDFGNPEDSSSTQQNPFFNYGTTGTFVVSLTVTTANGCTDNVDQEITIDPEFIFYAPNAFTPNGDSLNDIWFPKGVGIDITHYELWIFDRWGNQIFNTTDWSKGWDGKVQTHTEIVQEDVYVWKVKLKTFKGEKKSFIGRVTVIR